MYPSQSHTPHTHTHTHTHKNWVSGYPYLYLSCCLTPAVSYVCVRVCLCVCASLATLERRRKKNLSPSILTVRPNTTSSLNRISELSFVFVNVSTPNTTKRRLDYGILARISPLFWVSFALTMKKRVYSFTDRFTVHLPLQLPRFCDGDRGFAVEEATQSP